ncbi:MAG: biotin--[acetyl-CoA-carboxylase] ligase [bacterium]
MDRRVFGKEIYHYFCLESTNKVAYLLAKKGAEEGTVVVADEQTQGKGRGDHYWYSPQGGLWFSLILRPRMVFSEVPRLSILGAVGIAMSIDRLFPSLRVRIRWPNDVVIGDKKVAGVLVKVSAERASVQFAVMGIGVNLNIRDFPSPLSFIATSLIKETGHSTLKKRFLECALEELENLYFSSQVNARLLLEKARLFSSLLGWQVEVATTEGKFRGLAQDLDEDGGLILRLESGILKRIAPEEGYIKEKPQKI